MTKPTRPPIVPPEEPGTPPPSGGGGGGSSPGDGNIAGYPAVTTPYPDDPHIMLAISTDGGITWGEWLPRSLGKIGEYRQRVQWHRLGSSDKLVLKFSVSDPVPLTVLDLDVTLEGGKR